MYPNVFLFSLKKPDSFDLNLHCIKKSSMFRTKENDHFVHYVTDIMNREGETKAHVLKAVIKGYFSGMKKSKGLRKQHNSQCF